MIDAFHRKLPLVKTHITKGNFSNKKQKNLIFKTVLRLCNAFKNRFQIIN
jgi:hypothetical protein